MPSYDERRWPAARKILCVRVDNMGDVLMSTPAIRALKETFNAEITLLASNSGSEIAAHIPEIDRVILFDAPWVKTYGEPPTGQSLLKMAQRLRAEAFDAAIIFTVYSQNPLPAAMLTFLAGIPLRLAHSHENPYALLTDWVPDPEPQKLIRHEVRRQLDLVATVGAHTDDERLSLRTTPAIQERMVGLLAAQGIDPSEPWLILHPGVSEERRRYSEDGFIEVGRALSQELACRILVTGVGREASIVQRVAEGIGSAAVPLAGMLSLAELIHLIELAPLLIANNTGPIHMAAALGTPVVDVYANTNPQHAPWRVKHRLLIFDVPCKDCQRNICPMDHSEQQVRGVQPQEIVDAALSLWGERGLGIRDWGLGSVETIPLPSHQSMKEGIGDWRLGSAEPLSLPSHQSPITNP
jgi:lipopolysaccharide heptosyltransferase II